MDKVLVEAMANKFSENFAIRMLEKHKKICRRGRTHLDATPTFKSCSVTYETPCNCAKVSTTSEPYPKYGTPIKYHQMHKINKFQLFYLQYYLNFE